MTNINGIPAMGFGTFGRNGDVGIAAIETALDAGYRHIDTAQDYDTERECGVAIARSGLNRDEIFVTTKVSTRNLGRGRVVPSIEQSLDNLGMDRVDLALIHWPAPKGENIPLEIYIEQIAEAQARGLTTHIGVSNFTIDQIDRARAVLGDVPIADNQFELHPYLQNEKLAGHCRDLGIAVTCYCPIAKGKVVGDPVIGTIAEKHGAEPAQIALAYLMQKGYAVIPTSGKPERIRSNFGAADIGLDDSDMARMAALDRGERIIDPGWGPDWDQK